MNTKYEKKKQKKNKNEINNIINTQEQIESTLYQRNLK